MSSSKRLGLSATSIAVALVLVAVLLTPAANAQIVSHPDLAIREFSASDQTPSPESEFTLSAEAVNVGNAESKKTTIRFLRSTDPTIRTGRTVEGSTDFYPLAANGSETRTITLTLEAPTLGGTYYFGACIVPDGEETDIGNNCSASVKVTVNNPATGAPVISGTAQVGQTLTASTSEIADIDGLTDVNSRYHYQWMANSTDINGASTSTYTVQRSDYDTVITVRVTFADDVGNIESLTSAGTAAVVAGGI